MADPQASATPTPVDLDTLVNRIDAAVWNLLPGYDGSLLSRDEYRRYLTTNIDKLLTSVDAGRDLTESDTAAASELGERRADQGVPFESVIRSYRTSERIIVDTLLAGADHQQGTDLRSMITRLHNNNGALAEASYLSFLGALMTIKVSSDVAQQLRSALVAALVESDPTEVERIADILGVSNLLAHRTRAIVVHPKSARVEVSQDRLVAQLQNREIQTIAEGPWNEGAIVLALEPSSGPAQLADVARELGGSEGWRIAIGSQATDAFSLSGSIEDAIAALRFLPGASDSPTSILFDDVQTEILLATNSRRAASLATRHLGPILDDSDLMETLRAFVESGGSTKAAAQTLYLHPNSVTYRLNKIRDRLGKDPRDRKVLLDLAVALRAHTATRITKE